jgi:hypothetical protein
LHAPYIIPLSSVYPHFPHIVFHRLQLFSIRTYFVHHIPQTIYALYWIWTLVSHIAIGGFICVSLVGTHPFVYRSLAIPSSIIGLIQITGFRCLGDLFCYAHSYLMLCRLLVFISFSIILLTFIHTLLFVFVSSARNLRSQPLQDQLTLSFSDSIFSFYSTSPDESSSMHKHPHTTNVSNLAHQRLYKYPVCMPKLHYKGEVEGFVKGQDTLIIPKGYDYSNLTAAQTFTAYKTVDQKVKPVSGTFPQDALVRCWWLRRH